MNNATTETTTLRLNVATLFTTVFMAHIAFGICALTLFWFPAFTRKGSMRHRQFGVWYSNAMYGVVASAVIMASLSITIPELVKPEAFANALDPQKLRASMMRFSILLLHLALLTLVSIRYGQLVLKAKKDRTILKKPLQMLITVGLLLSGLMILKTGLATNHILMLIFGPLGIFIAVTNLIFTFKPSVKPNAWLKEHIGAYIGSGIGAYTAFISFGGRQIFETSGHLQITLWVAPGVIGTVFIFFLSRKYAN